MALSEFRWNKKDNIIVIFSKSWEIIEKIFFCLLNRRLLIREKIKKLVI